MPEDQLGDAWWGLHFRESLESGLCPAITREVGDVANVEAFAFLWDGNPAVRPGSLEAHEPGGEVTGLVRAESRLRGSRGRDGPEPTHATSHPHAAPHPPHATAYASHSSPH